ncbi:tRNA pseudouridine(38-40) synthase TruA [Flavobacterium sp.]|uniref:tRNA pseudouridine(38-40) synthase TruA n=1 Tax=Flavobacterium sp. TaxID=239 RepID=UPI00262B1090|nr:tRNA pseudouridine(38-40) synthase TruA [Flavobacterium sp.]MDD2986579.1 tRNA pseudouridine(38-40) synthase TruA [Flavobacterium sp.]
MRYFIKFAYNGTLYHGWQSQPNALTVQETLQKALSLLFKKHIELVGAGRTDTGVHAKEMYAHFDFNEQLETNFWIPKLNSYLPKDIVIYEIIPVTAEAHARFDATSRTYEYYIHSFKDAFLTDLSWYHYYPLDLERMNEAASTLLEYTDFECFSKTNTDVFTYNCKITEAFWQKKGNQLIFTITADRFLRNMVRAIVGTLINIGQGKIEVAQLQKIIESKNRSEAGFSAPAHGLYLTQIKYPYLSK